MKQLQAERDAAIQQKAAAEAACLRLRDAIEQALAFHQTTHIHAVLRETLSAVPGVPSGSGQPQLLCGACDGQFVWQQPDGRVVCHACHSVTEPCVMMVPKDAETQG